MSDGRPDRARSQRLADRLRAGPGAFAHRVRAALTLLGVVIGTGSIVLLASLLHGGERTLIETNQEASDEDVIEVHAEDPPPRQRYQTTRPLTRADAETLARDGHARGREGRGGERVRRVGALRRPAASASRS